MEFSFIVAILSDVPGPSTAGTWTDRASQDPLVVRFRTRTYRGADLALRREATTLARMPSNLHPADRERVDALRFAWANQVMGEVADLPGGPAAKIVDIRQVDPTRLGPPRRSTGLEGPGMVIDVWRRAGKFLVLVDRWALPATLMPWRKGDPVPWVNPETVAAVYRVIVYTHFPEVLHLRVGHRWRSEREPAGWPVLTRYAIPHLYDYMRPYYCVRGHHDDGSGPGAGGFPAALIRDIVDLVTLQCPHMAVGLTPERVTAIIQRHLRRANPKRLMGLAKFGVRFRKSTAKKKGRKKGPRK